MKKASRRSSFLARSTVLAAVIASGCRGNSGPTAANCTNIAGPWAASNSNSCGQSFQGTATVTQTECSFETSLGGTAIRGTINGNTFTFTGTAAAPCSAAISGSGIISGSTANGSYTGTSPGGAGCCPAGAWSGSFTLIR